MAQFLTRNVDFRSTAPDDGDGLTLEGYAAVFDQDTEINSYEGNFIERISKGAFKKTLTERTPVMQFDHGRDARTGSVPIGTFTELREDMRGLWVAGRLHDNPVVEPIRQAIASGAISGMSFRFRVIQDVWHDASGKALNSAEAQRLIYEPGSRGPIFRTIKEVALAEAGPVVFPAYAGTSVGVRSDNEPITQAERAAMRLRLLEL
ncbi:HK97 family phage prohead protease [Rhodococcus erythropolis]|uniref:Prohead serine protease domain-containing protein n=1 Tax=Rhodococcus erythropolis (strain PR4 / NBRC 100887) TaxID=234621 RepID=C1A248_RHOE4|nr:HK97 family phage prohead protease [Rhodococcus erythropolis]BAH34683.1 hypothetical protein RER_39750 [Rhodococcus erythropolis PR4]